MSLNLQTKQGATEVLSKDVSDLPVKVDATVHTRLGWIIVLIGVGGFLLWALFAPLDKGVPVSASVSVSTNLKAVQHLNGGKVDEILVKEGGAVKAGQPLVRMNDVQVRSAVDVARVQSVSARAMEARLIAERDGLSAVVFPEDLLKAQSDPQIANHLNVQRQLFSSRKAALQSELAAADENVAGMRAQLQGLQENAGMLKQQQAFLKEQVDSLRELTKEGYVARNRLLELERTYSQTNGAMFENIAGASRTVRQISEINLRRSQRQQEYQKEVRTQLTDVQREAEALDARLKSLDYDLANVIVRAPVDGTVVGMNIFTQGGVIGPGHKMMDIVPSGDPLVVDGMVPTNLIDKVHPGLPVELIFSAFNVNTTPHIPGVVTTVSADKLVDEKTGMPYYKMSAKVTPEGLKMLANLQVRPGMPVELFIKTGERTMMNYLMRPIIDRIKTSLTEE